MKRDGDTSPKDFAIARSSILGPRLGRRFLLQLSVAGGSSFFPVFGVASTLTGVDALDTSALTVRRPANVLLVAIASAGKRLVAVGEHGVIIYSDDDGAAWTQASVPVNAVLTCLSFATPLLGWAGGHFGVILRTSDGGETWKRQLNGIEANQLTLAAAQTASTEKSTWPGVDFALKRAEIFVDGGASLPFLSLLALSPQKVIAFGAYRMTMLTTDSGTTWSDWSLHIDDRLSHNLYDATIIGTDIYVVGETGLVFCSSDNGNSFPQVTSPCSATLFGVVGAEDGSLIVFGIAGNIFRSADRGKTWVAVTLDTQDNLVAARLLASGQILVAGESGQLFLSKDDGLTFEPVRNCSLAPVFDFEQTRDKGLVFVGPSGAVRVPMTVCSL
jgi:photosystem II stability/assembly factor-like uncharacterized protein